MDNKNLLELKSRLSALPVLEDRLIKLQDRIFKAKTEVDALLRQYEKESLDVERIRKESLSTTILKFFGRYEGRVEKEMEEMVHAKTQYDAASAQLRELESEAARLRSRIAELTRDRQAYQVELEKRESMIRASTSGEASKAFMRLEAEAENLARQLTETGEALRAADRAYHTAQEALAYLDDAEGWASYDVWFSKGLISHMAKYEKIDMAQEAFDRLNAQIHTLRVELDDIHLDLDIQPLAIDSATRFFDVWFDNIFTDLRVRDQIRDYLNYTKELCGVIERVINRLETSKRDLTERIQRIEEQQENIIISFEAGG